MTSRIDMVTMPHGWKVVARGQDDKPTVYCDEHGRITVQRRAFTNYWVIVRNDGSKACGPGGNVRLFKSAPSAARAADEETVR